MDQQEPAMSPHQPESYPRRTLLLVTGATPQILTETLYYLTQKARPAFVPTEIQVITTQIGEEKLHRTLLDTTSGWFHRLRDECDLPSITFSKEQIRVMPDAHGNPLDDIRTPEGNECAANFITDTVRQLAEDDSRAIHASLAGGRKTMGYYLGYALSLFGRPQDRLSHVLVSPGFESRWDFFYPRLGQSDDERADIQLAEIPFVRLRDQLPASLKTLESGMSSFSGIVRAAQRALDPAGVLIDYRNGCLELDDGHRITLSPASIAFYGWIARHTQQGRPVFAPSKQKPNRDHLKTFLEEVGKTDARSQTARVEESVHGGMTRAYWDDRKAHLRQELVSALGPLAEAYDIRAITPSRPAGYGLPVESSRIRFLSW